MPARSAMSPIDVASHPLIRKSRLAASTKAIRRTFGRDGVRCHNLLFLPHRGLCTGDKIRTAELGVNTPFGIDSCRFPLHIFPGSSRSSRNAFARLVRPAETSGHRRRPAASTGVRLRTARRPAGGHRSPAARHRRRGARTGPARRHGFRQDLHGRAGDRRPTAPHPRPGAEQDTRRATVRGR